MTPPKSFRPSHSLGCVQPCFTCCTTKEHNCKCGTSYSPAILVSVESGKLEMWALLLCGSGREGALSFVQMGLLMLQGLEQGCPTSKQLRATCHISHSSQSHRPPQTTHHMCPLPHCAMGTPVLCMCAGTPNSLGFLAVGSTAPCYAGAQGSTTLPLPAPGEGTGCGSWRREREPRGPSSCCS